MIHSYTVTPATESIPELMPLDLGCITSTNQIPPLDLTMVDLAGHCSVLTASKLRVSDLVLLDDCTWSQDRVFALVNLCGATVEATQTITWVLNDIAPEIVLTESDADHGCQGSYHSHRYFFHLRVGKTRRSVDLILVGQVHLEFDGGQLFR